MLLGFLIVFFSVLDAPLFVGIERFRFIQPEFSFLGFTRFPKFFQPLISFGDFHESEFAHPRSLIGSIEKVKKNIASERRLFYKLVSGRSQGISPLVVNVKGQMPDRVAEFGGGTYTLSATSSTNGLMFSSGNTGGLTIADTSGTASIPSRSANSFAAPTLTSSAAQTIATASTLLISGAPAAGTNTTITNALALNVTAGTSAFSGNVGIGTATPGSALEVAGSGQVRLSGSTPRLTLTPAASGTSNLWNIDNNGGKLRFFREDFAASGTGSSGADRMTITDSGNVGIGTTAPSTKLEVAGGITLKSSVQFDGIGINNGTYNVAVIQGSSASNDTGLFSLQSAGVVKTLFNAGGSSYFNGGNVGIGTNNPGYSLHVVGTAGLSTGTSWTNASDIRLKDIHGDYEHGLSDVLKLHTVRYNYRKDNALGLPSNFEKVGFIAREVEKVIPEAVHRRSDGFLELNVDPIHWAVVNAVKQFYSRWFADSRSIHEELAAVKASDAAKSEEIAKLQARDFVKDEEIAALKKRLNRIEHMLEMK